MYVALSAFWMLSISRILLSARFDLSTSQGLCCDFAAFLLLLLAYRFTNCRLHQRRLQITTNKQPKEKALHANLSTRANESETSRQTFPCNEMSKICQTSQPPRAEKELKLFWQQWAMESYIFGTLRLCQPQERKKPFKVQRKMSSLALLFSLSFAFALFFATKRYIYV